MLNLKNKFLSVMYKTRFLMNKGVSFKAGLILNKMPIVILKNDSILRIGKNVKLNSDNSKYHINMNTCIKLYADGENSKIIIGDNTRVHGSCLHARKQIKIGSNCLIAANCQIFDCNGHDVFLNNPEKRIDTFGNSKPIEIGDNCWIGANSVLLPGTKLGNNCVIGAMSVVRGVFSDNSLIFGNPAVCVKVLK